LRQISRELNTVGLTDAWAGRAQAALMEHARSGAPTFDHTAARYEAYAGALLRYAGDLDQVSWELIPARRDLQARLDVVGRSGARRIAGNTAVAVAEVDSGQHLLPAALRFKYSYDRWADAVDRCTASILLSNTADPLHDPHGWHAAGQAIKAAVTLKNIAHVLERVGSALSLIGLALLPICPHLATAVFAAAAVVAAGQFCIDLARKGRGEQVTWLGVAAEAMAFVPGGKIAGAGVKAVEHAVVAKLEQTAAHEIEHTAVHEVEIVAAGLAKNTGAKQAALGAESEPGLSTRLVPDGGLARHEGVNGSHTIAKHVGKSLAYLKNRIATEMKGVVSTFVSRAEAETSIAAGLEAKRVEIAKWLQGTGKKTLALDHDLGRQIGMVLYRDADVPTHGTGVRMILRRNPDFVGGYNIHTAMVTP
jgi:hypothetical protein